jgi:hypothetical protein
MVRSGSSNGWNRGFSTPLKLARVARTGLPTGAWLWPCMVKAQVLKVLNQASGGGSMALSQTCSRRSGSCSTEVMPDPWHRVVGDEGTRAEAGKQGRQGGRLRNLRRLARENGPRRPIDSCGGAGRHSRREGADRRAKESSRRCSGSGAAAGPKLGGR